jgi:hypothetical protein
MPALSILITSGTKIITKKIVMIILLIASTC